MCTKFQNTAINKTNCFEFSLSSPEGINSESSIPSAVSECFEIFNVFFPLRYRAGLLSLCFMKENLNH